LLTLETLESQLNHEYIQLTEPREVDSFKINEVGRAHFKFLKELGIIDYKETFKIWLRKFPRPLFVICVDGKNILAWVYVEEWENSAFDGSPVYVLRSIETAEEYRRKKIGYRLLLIVANEIPGYLITKPINRRARKFFLSNGFLDKDDMELPVIDLQRHPGYLILPPFKKKKLLEEYEQYFDQKG